MTKQLVYRILAWTIDFGIIVLYAVLLFAGTSLLLDVKPVSNPFVGQLIGFFTLTLPVFTYSYLTEKGKRKATIGKSLVKLEVVAGHNNRTKSVLLRNVLKYLPWELAHIGVHWIVYYASKGLETPIWIWMTLIVPQVMMFVYFVSVVVSRGQSSIYDRISNTSLRLNTTE